MALSRYREGQWTVVIPFYNEAEYIESTIRSFFAQKRLPEAMVVVDNASTDDSPAIVRRLSEGAPFAVHLAEEKRPGKVNALETALALVGTEFVALADADSYYPPGYLATLERRYDDPDVVSVLAFGFSPDMTAEARARFVGRRMKLVRRFSRRCFTGGYGHTYRSEALHDVGGYSARQWPFVLMDHEIIHRLNRLGRVVHAPDAWCETSDRRTDRRNARWTLQDRWLYRHTPDRFMDWFFYTYLWKRFERRGLYNTRLREQPWRAEAPPPTRDNT